MIAASSSTILDYSRLIDHPLGVLYHMPFGQRNGVDQAGRVYRARASPGNCFYIAADRLRREAVIEAQANVEQNFRELQARLCELNAHIPSAVYQAYLELDANPADSRIGITIAQAKLCIARANACLANRIHLERLKRQCNHPSLETTKGFCQNTLTIYGPFTQQTQFTRFLDYLNDRFLGVRKSVYLDFCHRMGIDLTNIRAALQKEYATTESDFESLYRLNPKIFTALLQCEIQTFYVSKFQFLQVTWSSNDTISYLLAILKKKKGVLAGGDLGFHMYKTDPKALNQGSLGGRPVYGWAPGSVKVSHAVLNHLILVIGAEQNPTQPELGVVYFLDPNDPSDPDNPLNEKIYKISFKTFSERVKTLYIAEN